MIPIRNCVLQSGSQEGIAKKNGDIFCGQKVFTMLQHRKRSMQILVTLLQSIMRNPMGRASWHLHRTIFEQMDCISLMSRRRHCLHSGSLHCWWKFTVVQRREHSSLLLHILQSCWGYRERRSIALIMAGFICVNMRKRKVTRSQKCLLIIEKLYWAGF